VHQPGGEDRLGIGYFHKLPETILAENNLIYTNTFQARRAPPRTDDLHLVVDGVRVRHPVSQPRRRPAEQTVANGLLTDSAAQISSR
jgi:hypothetical protein